MANQIKYSIVISKPVRKSLEKIANLYRAKNFSAIAKLADNPRPHGSIKLQGTSDLWRIRTSDYRVVYKIEDKKLIIEVIRIADRKDAYR